MVQAQLSDLATKLINKFQKKRSYYWCSWIRLCWLAISG